MVNNYVFSKTVHGKLVLKVNAINTNGFFLKTHYDTNKLVLEKKINDAGKNVPDFSWLVKKKLIMRQKLVKEKAKYLVLPV